MADESVIGLDFAKLKVPDLKRELRNRGLSTSGNKNDLVERLQSSLQNSKHENDSVDDLIDDDLLNDDELEHEGDHLEGDTDLTITDLDATIESPPALTKVQTKRKLEDLKLSSESKGPKKLVLNRNLSSTEDAGDVVTSNGGAALKQDDDSTPTQEKKVVKLSELTEKERLEMRSKKFGAPVTEVGKKAVRAARFGDVGSVTSTGTITVGNGSAGPSVDVLKKRAERFGGTVSTALTKIEVQEKLEKRKARFGTSVSSNGNKADADTVKQQRLERFKTTVK